MLQLAQAGYMGVNLHGGGNGLYTPIAGSLEEGFAARPVYYGMLLAEHFSGSTFLESSLSVQRPDQNVTGFASENAAGLKLALFNKAPQQVTIRIQGVGSKKSKASTTFLHGRAIDAKQGVTFGDSSVGSDGSFSPKPQASIAIRSGSGVLVLPRYTAALVEL